MGMVIGFVVDSHSQYVAGRQTLCLSFAFYKVLVLQKWFKTTSEVAVFLQGSLIWSRSSVQRIFHWLTGHASSDHWP